MAKYRIEDITPPEKRKRVRARANGAQASDTKTPPTPPGDVDASSVVPTPDTEGDREIHHGSRASVDDLLRDAFPGEKRKNTRHPEQKVVEKVARKHVLKPTVIKELPRKEKEEEVEVEPVLDLSHAHVQHDASHDEEEPDDDLLDTPSARGVRSDFPDDDDDDFEDDTASSPSDRLSDHIETSPRHYSYENDDRRASSDARDIGRRVGMFLLGAGICAVIGAVLVHFVFDAAVVSVTPKSETVQIKNTLSAAQSATDGVLPFAVMKVEMSDEKEIPATGTKEVSTKASGKIVVYNDFSSKTQRLIKNTRFQSSDGKVYRINASVDVPGQKTSGGKTTPGSIEVTIYADEPGEAYNKAPTDFTIPGFSGDPRYEKIYARSSTPVTGGESGTVTTVSDEDLKRASDDLRIALETKLRTKAHSDIAPTQIAFDGAVYIQLGEPTLEKATASSAPNTATLEQSGSLYAVVFDRKAIAREIARIGIPGYKDEAVDARGLEKMAFTMEPESGDELFNAEKITFDLEGTAVILYSVDGMALRRDLAGIKKSELNTIISAYPAIDKAIAKIRPVWKTVFPKDPDRITVTVEDPVSAR